MKLSFLHTIFRGSAVGASNEGAAASCWEYPHRFTQLFLDLVASKHQTRPDSVLTCCWEAIPYIRQSFNEQCWTAMFKVCSYMNRSEDDLLKTGLIALEAVHELESGIESNTIADCAITPESARCIEIFLSKPLSDSDYTKLSAHLKVSGKSKLWKTLKACRELFFLQQADYVAILRTKMENIERSAHEPIDAPFNAEYRLTPHDLRLLTVAEARRKMLAVLSDRNIHCYSQETLIKAWEEIEHLNGSEAMAALKSRCEKGYKAGQIFFYDWHFIEIRDFYPLDLSWAVKHILRSRIPHLGIIIMDEHDKPHFSHVNGAMERHGIHPIRFHALGALGNFGELDITPLIPRSVSSDHHDSLKNCFHESFIKFAAEVHPEVQLEWNLTSLLGHKKLSRQSLTEVDLSADEKQSCSSYVGVIFLKAVNEVNKLLSTLGYDEKIPHPFGEHEIVNRVDTLRLIYHWKQLKVLKVVPLDAFVSKVFDSPQM